MADCLVSLQGSNRCGTGFFFLHVPVVIAVRLEGVELAEGGVLLRVVGAVQRVGDDGEDVGVVGRVFPGAGQVAGVQFNRHFWS